MIVADLAAADLLEIDKNRASDRAAAALRANTFRAIRCLEYYVCC